MSIRAIAARTQWGMCFFSHLFCVRVVSFVMPPVNFYPTFSVPVPLDRNHRVSPSGVLSALPRTFCVLSLRPPRPSSARGCRSAIEEVVPTFDAMERPERLGVARFSGLNFIRQSAGEGRPVPAGDNMKKTVTKVHEIRPIQKIDFVFFFLKPLPEMCNLHRGGRDRTVLRRSTLRSTRAFLRL